MAGRQGTVCAVNCVSYSKGETAQAGNIRYAQKATKQNQVMLTEAQVSTLPQRYFSVTWSIWQWQFQKVLAINSVDSRAHNNLSFTADSR